MKGHATEWEEVFANKYLMKNLYHKYKELLHIDDRKADNTILCKRWTGIRDVNIVLGKGDIQIEIFIETFFKYINIQEGKIKTPMQCPPVVLN